MSAKSLVIGKLPVSTFFKIKIFIEIIVDSHALVRNNTEKSLVHFVQFPKMVTFCRTTM